MKTITLELPEELIADLGYAKLYAQKLQELKRKYPQIISGIEQRTYVDRNVELLEKVSLGLEFALKRAGKA